MKDKYIKIFEDDKWLILSNTFEQEQGMSRSTSIHVRAFNGGVITCTLYNKENPTNSYQLTVCRGLISAVSHDVEQYCIYDIVIHQESSNIDIITIDNSKVQLVTDNKQ